MSPRVRHFTQTLGLEWWWLWTCKWTHYTDWGATDHWLSCTRAVKVLENLGDNMSAVLRVYTCHSPPSHSIAEILKSNLFLTVWNIKPSQEASLIHFRSSSMGWEPFLFIVSLLYGIIGVEPLQFVSSYGQCHLMCYEGEGFLQVLFMSTILWLSQMNCSPFCFAM